MQGSKLCVSRLGQSLLRDRGDQLQLGCTGFLDESGCHSAQHLRRQLVQLQRMFRRQHSHARLWTLTKITSRHPHYRCACDGWLDVIDGPQQANDHSPMGPRLLLHQSTNHHHSLRRHLLVTRVGERHEAANACRRRARQAGRASAEGTDGGNHRALVQVPQVHLQLLQQEIDVRALRVHQSGEDLELQQADLIRVLCLEVELEHVRREDGRVDAHNVRDGSNDHLLGLGSGGAQGKQKRASHLCELVERRQVEVQAGHPNNHCRVAALQKRSRAPQQKRVVVRKHAGTPLRLALALVFVCALLLPSSYRWHRRWFVILHILVSAVLLVVRLKLLADSVFALTLVLFVIVIIVAVRIKILGLCKHVVEFLCFHLLHRALLRHCPRCIWHAGVLQAAVTRIVIRPTELRACVAQKQICHEHLAPFLNVHHHAAKLAKVHMQQIEALWTNSEKCSYGRCYH
mmetsp:Transcript_5179/g.9854  ORF Transcript_5179/g.9854 Transcript_5179/m.9854 type:complete len:459 (+) Transcript_5179:980-2356(+)